MPKKIKEVSSEQTCENCKWFDLPESHKKCSEKCKKQIIMTRFRPNEEESLIESLDANPDLKAKVKKRLEEADAGDKV